MKTPLNILILLGLIVLWLIVVGITSSVQTPNCFEDEVIVYNYKTNKHSTCVSTDDFIYEMCFFTEHEGKTIQKFTCDLTYWGRSYPVD